MHPLFIVPNIDGRIGGFMGNLGDLITNINKAKMLVVDRK